AHAQLPGHGYAAARRLLGPRSEDLARLPGGGRVAGGGSGGGDRARGARPQPAGRRPARHPRPAAALNGAPRPTQCGGTSMTQTLTIQGPCDPASLSVREAFAKPFGDPAEAGAALAVFVDGRPAVDLWAGHRDAARTLPWERDTIVVVYSATKGA